MDVIIFLALMFAALASFASGWDRWSLSAPAPDYRHWRHTAGGIACLVVAAEALNPLALLVIAFSPLSRDAEVLRKWVRSTPWLFIFGAVFLMCSKGPTRWYLLLSSVLSLVVTFLTIVAIFASEVQRGL